MQFISKRTYSLKRPHVLHVANPPDVHRQEKLQSITILFELNKHKSYKLRIFFPLESYAHSCIITAGTLTVRWVTDDCVCLRGVEKISLEVLITGQSWTSYRGNFYKKTVSSKLVKHSNMDLIISWFYQLASTWNRLSNMLHFTALTSFFCAMITQSQRMVIPFFCPRLKTESLCNTDQIAIKPNNIYYGLFLVIWCLKCPLGQHIGRWQCV